MYLKSLSFDADLPWLHCQADDAVDICNGRETRRSHNKEIKLVDSLSSGKSSSRISPDCYQAQKLFSNELKPTAQKAEKCVGTGMVDVYKIGYISQSLV